MDIEYEIEYEVGLEDLIRRHRAEAEPRSGMSRWFELLCALILGPAGILRLVIAFSHRLHSRQTTISIGEIVGFVLCLYCASLPFSFVWNSHWTLRWRLERRIRNNPLLVGKRSLSMTPTALFESTPHALNDVANVKNKYAFVRKHVFHTWSWLTLKTVKEDLEYMMLFSETGQAIFVPISGKPPAEMQAFREALMAHWHCAKTGQPLLSTEDVWPPPPQNK